jgi:antitoxin (DNA-binding transcriptional repressor) of toxin-antitoxin stability system
LAGYTPASPQLTGPNSQSFSLVDKALAGEEVLIGKAGKPLVRWFGLLATILRASPDGLTGKSGSRTISTLLMNR